MFLGCSAILMPMGLVPAIYSAQVMRNWPRPGRP